MSKWEARTPLVPEDIQLSPEFKRAVILYHRRLTPPYRYLESHSG